MDHGRAVRIVFAVLSPRSEKLVLEFVLVGCVHNPPDHLGSLKTWIIIGLAAKKIH